MRSIAWGRGAFAVTMLVAAMGLAFAGPARAATGVGTITGPGGKCVEVAGGNNANGTQVQLLTCNGGAAQRWTNLGDGRYQALGKCLDVAGTQVRIWDCDGADSQQWSTAVGSNRLGNPSSGQCLDATSANPADGTPLQIAACNLTATQQWNLPAPASTTSASYFVPLVGADGVNGIVSLTPSNSDTYQVIKRADFPLQAGETRRIADRLGVVIDTAPGDAPDGAEVDNRLVCGGLDAQGNFTELARASSGTNHRGAAYGELGLYESMLFTAPQAGPYECQIQAQTSDGNRMYSAQAVLSGMPASTNGTWLQISSADEVGSHMWPMPSVDYCGSSGTDLTCDYLGGPGDSRQTQIFADGIAPADRDIWTAGGDATTVDVTGTFQITSCPDGTSSCKQTQWGPSGINRPKYAEVWSYLEFDQLNPDGSVCRLNQSSDPDTGNVYYIDNSVHHLPIVYHLTVSVSPDCGGSRRFAPKVFYQWIGGNPVKIDGGNISAINSVRTTAATVPTVVGLFQTTANPAARAALQAVGLKAGYVQSVPNAAAAGTVIGQGAPGATVEPVASAVNLTVSAGPTPDLFGASQSAAAGLLGNAQLSLGTVSTVADCAHYGTVRSQSPAAYTVLAANSPVNIAVATCTVPDVLSLDQASATNSINASGLVLGTVSTTNNCVDPGSVQVQSPSPGTSVSPGTPVAITVSTCVRTGGGGGIPK